MRSANSKGSCLYLSSQTRLNNVFVCVIAFIQCKVKKTRKATGHLLFQPRYSNVKTIFAAFVLILSIYQKCMQK